MGDVSFRRYTKDDGVTARVKLWATDGVSSYVDAIVLPSANYAAMSHDDVAAMMQERWDNYQALIAPADDTDPLLTATPAELDAARQLLFDVLYRIKLKRLNRAGRRRAARLQRVFKLGTTYYWVGGSGTWDGSTSTHWALTSGGAGGAGVPTSGDPVIFDRNSGTGTAFVVTASTNMACGGFDASDVINGNAMTWGGTGFITGCVIAGAILWPASNFTSSFSTTSTVTLQGGGTITTNGRSLNGNGTTVITSGTWTLGSAMSVGNGFQVTGGSFSAAGYSLTCLVFTKGASGSVDLGSSTITCAGTTTAWNATAGSGTFNAGTSTIVASGSPPVFNGGGLTYCNLSFTNTGSNTGAGGANISGANTFTGTVTFTRPASPGTRYIGLAANQTIGTLTFTGGGAATMRVSINSSVRGQQNTLTVGTVTGAADVNFKDTIIAGAASPLTGTRIGDCGNNSGITFTAAANKYWSLAAGGNAVSSTAWATSSGGTPAVNNLPLPQDTAIYQDTGLNSGATVTYSIAWDGCALDFSGRTLPMTLSITANQYLHYGVTLSSAVTPSGSTNLNLWGSGTQTITSAGATWTQALAVDSGIGAVKLGDNLTSSAAATLTSGSTDLNTHTLSIPSLTNTGTLTRSLGDSVGGGKLALSGAGTAYNGASTGFSTFGNWTISLTDATTGKTFAGGGQNLTGVALSQDGNSTLTISGSNHLGDLTNTVNGTTIKLTAGTTTTFDHAPTLHGAAGSQTLLQSTTTSQATISLASGTAAFDQVVPTHITATGGATWYALNAANDSTNVGIIFPPPVSGVAAATAAGGMTIGEVASIAGVIVMSHAGGIGVKEMPTVAGVSITSAAGSLKVAEAGVPPGVEAHVAAGLVTGAVPRRPRRTIQAMWH